MFTQTLFAAKNTVVPVIILALYLVLMVGIAYYCRKRSGSLNDFLLAGRGLNGWMSAFAYGTTYFSAVIFIGYAGKFGWNYGLAAIWIGVMNAVLGTYLAWKVLAKRTRNLTRNLSARTLPEFFEKRYESPKIKMASSIIIFIFLIPYSTSVYQGLAYLFEGMFGIPFVWCIVLMAGVTALYLFFGGYMATSLTDFVQGLIMLFGVTIMVLVLLGKADWGEGLKNISENFGLIPSTSAPSGRVIDTPMFNVIILCLLTSFGIWGLPQSIHKFYAIRDNSAIKKGTVVSTAFSLIVGGGAYFVGSLVRAFYSDTSAFGTTATGAVNFDTVIPIMLTEHLPSFLLGLIMVLVLSASMSTLAALSLASASSISLDMYKGYVNKDADDKKVKTLLRALCIVFVALSALLAMANVQAIVTFMSLSWGTLAGCFIGPYVLGLYSKKITKQAAWSSIIGCLVITAVMIICLGVADGGVGFGNIVSKGIGRSPFIGVVTMAASMVITVVVSLFTKAPSPAVTELVGADYVEPTAE